MLRQKENYSNEDTHLSQTGRESGKYIDFKPFHVLHNKKDGRRDARRRSDSKLLSRCSRFWKEYYKNSRKKNRTKAANQQQPYVRNEINAAVLIFLRFTSRRVASPAASLSQAKVEQKNREREREKSNPISKINTFEPTSKSWKLFPWRQDFSVMLATLLLLMMTTTMMMRRQKKMLRRTYNTRIVCIYISNLRGWK